MTACSHPTPLSQHRIPVISLRNSPAPRARFSSWLPICSLVCSAVFFCLMAADSDSVLYVDGSQTGDGNGSLEHPFATIQLAMSAAHTNTIIKIAEGRYDAKPLNISIPGIQIIGGFSSGSQFSVNEPNNHLTVLAGNGKEPVVEINGADRVQVKGCSITGGTHGILVHGGDKVVIINNRIYKNGSAAVSSGGGISLEGTTNCSILNNAILDNMAADDGGGIGFRRGIAPKSLRIDGNYIFRNTIVGEHGGGIFSGGDAIVSNCLIEENVAQYGSGVFINEGIIVITDSIIRKNSSHGIFAIDYTHQGKPGHSIERVLICDNAVGISSFWASLKIYQCTVANNKSATDDWRDDPQQELIVSSCIFWNSSPAILCKKTTITDSISDGSLAGDGVIKQDPKFIAPNSPTPDYRLLADSPARKDGEIADIGFPRSHFDKFANHYLWSQEVTSRLKSSDPAAAPRK